MPWWICGSQPFSSSDSPRIHRSVVSLGHIIKTIQSPQRVWWDLQMMRLFVGTLSSLSFRKAFYGAFRKMGVTSKSLRFVHVGFSMKSSTITKNHPRIWGLNLWVKPNAPCIIPQSSPCSDFGGIKTCHSRRHGWQIYDDMVSGDVYRPSKIPIHFSERWNHHVFHHFLPWKLH